MDKEIFKENVETYKKSVDFLEESSNFGIDLYETPVCLAADAAFDCWLKAILNDEGVDIVYWWLFEDVDKVLIYANEEIVVEDLENLYKYLSDNGYFKS